MKVILVLTVTLSGLACAQFKNPTHRFGGVRPTRLTTFSPEGQYRGVQYPKDKGGNDGRYIPDDTGRYIHMAQPYDGGYGDKGHRGGHYSGDSDKYQHVTGPSGGSGAPFRHSVQSGIKPTLTTPLSIISNVQETSAKFPRYTPTPTQSSIFNRPTPAPLPVTTRTYNAINNNNINNGGSQQSAASRFRSNGNDGGWKILRQDQTLDTSSYNYAYETENRIKAEEVGRLETYGQDEGVRTSGFYEYYGDDGQKYRVDYTADENGFVPKAAHLPEGLEQAIELVARSGN